MIDDRPIPLPASEKEYWSLAAPFVRLRSKHGRCLIMGKAIGVTAEHIYVAVLYDGRISSKRYARKRVHLTRCKHCGPDPVPS